MFSKREATEPKHATAKRRRLIPLVALAVALVGVFVYVTPASTNVDRARLDDRPGIANNAPIKPWGEGLSEGAVNWIGIEPNLETEAHALPKAQVWAAESLNSYSDGGYRYYENR